MPSSSHVYYPEDKNFQEYISEYDTNQMREELSKSDFPIHDLYDKYPLVYKYFDDWIVVLTNKAEDCAVGFIMKPKGEKHIETIEWDEKK